MVMCNIHHVKCNIGASCTLYVEFIRFLSLLTECWLGGVIDMLITAWVLLEVNPEAEGNDGFLFIHRMKRGSPWNHVICLRRFCQCLPTAAANSLNICLRVMITVSSITFEGPVYKLHITDLSEKLNMRKPGGSGVALSLFPQVGSSSIKKFAWWTFVDLLASGLAVLHWYVKDSHDTQHLDCHSCLHHSFDSNQ